MEWSGGVWRAIKTKWKGIKSMSHFLVGNGRRVKYQKNLRYKDQTLEEAFSNLCSFSSNKDGWVAKQGSKLVKGVVGAPIFLKGNLMIESLMKWIFLSKIKIVGNQKGIGSKLSWNETKSGNSESQFLYLGSILGQNSNS